ncbi:MAG TPA: peptidase S10 [Terriglobia bacterium]|nr:peptidase S10 [Terriglobia bacterium]
MRALRLVLQWTLVVLIAAAVYARPQEPDSQGEQAESAAKAGAAGEREGKREKGKKKEEEKPPVVTHHEIHVGGRTLKYTATVGLMPLTNEQAGSHDEGKVQAHIFYMAYTLDNPAAGKRPLTFCFNGGPGSSSVWLHMGAIGPRKVVLEPDGTMPPPPFELEDNQDTWLDQTDLVFIDPVGTGFSRPTKPEYGKQFWGVKGDIASVGQFIRLYLTRNERWQSPLFLAGESYGTTRAAGLSGYLIDHGIALNGIVLVSTVLNFETLEFTRGNDLPYILYLPSYATTAWYHKKLPPDLQSEDLAKVVAEVEQWAANDYALALAKGDALTAAERQSVVEHLARYTGLSKTYIDEANLRITEDHFTKELLRDQSRTVGRLDSRFEGIDESGVSEGPDYDPSEAAIRPPFTAVFNNYVRSELGWKTDDTYYILGGGFRQWDWGSAGRGFANVSPSLRTAFVKNKYMKLFVAEGYFDLATPFFAVDYTLAHLGLDPSLRGNVSTGQFPVGHMVYIESKSLDKLKRDVAAFMAGALR